eukprot:365279-Chlamydomonas_euryale.AAC.4
MPDDRHLVMQSLKHTPKLNTIACSPSRDGQAKGRGVGKAAVCAQPRYHRADPPWHHGRGDAASRVPGGSNILPH